MTENRFEGFLWSLHVWDMSEQISRSILAETASLRTRFPDLLPGGKTMAAPHYLTGNVGIVAEVAEYRRNQSQRS